MQPISWNPYPADASPLSQDNADTEPSEPVVFWPRIRHMGRSEGEQPCPSMLEEQEKQQEGQHMRLLGHSGVIHSEDCSEDGLGAATGIVNALLMVAVFVVFAAILYGFFIKV